MVLPVARDGGVSRLRRTRKARRGRLQDMPRGAGSRQSSGAGVNSTDGSADCRNPARALVIEAGDSQELMDEITRCFFMVKEIGVQAALFSIVFSMCWL